TSFVGDDDDYVARKAVPLPAPELVVSVDREPRERSAPTEPDRRRSRRKDVERESEAIRARLGRVEGQIHALEARLAEIGGTLSDPELYRDGRRARDAA